MKNIDYIIVGGGYAGVFFAHQLLKNNKSFVIYHNQKESGSHISAGVCNPVILKRFNTFWKSNEQLDYLHIIFKEIEAYTNANYLISEPVVRIFHNEDEKKQWIKNSDKADLNSYLNKDFIKLISVKNDYLSGIVNHSSRIDVTKFFSDYFSFLENNQLLIKEDFVYESLNVKESKYKDFNFKKIIFCEGISAKNNPYFSQIPIQTNKGHCLELEIDEQIDPFIIKKKHFLFSQNSGNRYYYGGTYDRFDQSNAINEESVSELQNGLEEIFKKDYKINNIKTGFRATIADRKPVLGQHYLHPNLYIFNGLGARGVLNGSFFSKELYDYLENDKPLISDVDVKRFYDEISSPN